MNEGGYFHLSDFLSDDEMKKVKEIKARPGRVPPNNKPFLAGDPVYSLRFERLAQGLTIKQLSEKVGLSTYYIYALENGEYSPRKLNKKLMEFLNNGRH